MLGCLMEDRKAHSCYPVVSHGDEGLVKQLGCARQLIALSFTHHAIRTATQTIILKDFHVLEVALEEFLAALFLFGSHLGIS